MAVERIEQYDDILKVILKPTKKFPVGYFYCDSEDIDLVRSHRWYLVQKGKSICVVAVNHWRDVYLFHRELAFKYLDYYPEEIDHKNSLEFDNVDCNLNVVTYQQNNFNRLTRGYLVNNNSFQPFIRYNYAFLFPYGTVHTEVEACQLAYLAETDFLKLKMQDDYYMFDFLKYRRGSEEILDLERTKQISPEEATYRHVMKYADNAWYYLRYNLAEYFKDNHIPVPSYSLDEQGFMVHPITNQKLCPFEYKGGR